MTINQMDDHDLLIELKTDFKAFTQQYRVDISDIKSGTSGTLADHESRINKIEDMINQVQPIMVVKEFRELQREVRDYVVGAKSVLWVSSLVSAIGGGVVGTALIATLKWLGVIR